MGGFRGNDLSSGAPGGEKKRDRDQRDARIMHELVYQPAASRLDHPRQKEQSDQRHEADEEEHVHGSVERVDAARRDRANEKGADRGNKAPGVIGKSWTGSSKPRWIQLGEVEGKAPEDP